MPMYLRIYDGTTNPEYHITHYVIAVKGNDLSKEHVSSVLLKKFGETLTKGALTWYSQLLARSIETFEDMADKFVTAHVGAKKAETRVNDIFAIKKFLGKGLRDFLSRFNRVRMTLPNVSKGMAVAAFQNGMGREGSRATRKLLIRLTKERIDNARRNHPISRPNRKRLQPYVKAPVLPPIRYDDGPSRSRTTTRMNKREIIYALEKLGTKVKWTPKIRSDTSTRKFDALCEFHQEREHKIEDCIAFRQKVVNILQQGHLKDLVSNKGRSTFARGQER
uniref:Retrotransposon gag domain-containing protein n=1 Tax=Nicotiana tabacum TaxID=4097 RepID=A0A1S4DDI7_TOBAC|nr:PREDICTED: uncharacterized protein LOC107828575 [Nicotiana tabacum]